MVYVALLAALTGTVAGLVAYVLYVLLALTLNLVFFQRVAFEIPGLEGNTLGYWIVVVPIVGGLIVSVMARFGTPRIRGHGIPEAIEAITINRSRVSPKVAFRNLRHVSQAMMPPCWHTMPGPLWTRKGILPAL